MIYLFTLLGYRTELFFFMRFSVCLFLSIPKPAFCVIYIYFVVGSYELVIWM